MLGAHPDDETILTGGTLALLAEQGVQVHLVCATRGEGGDAGDPPLCEPAMLGQFREGELRCAAEALGAASVTFLGYEDPPVGAGNEMYAFDADFDTMVTQVLGAILELQPDVVLTHGSNGEYGHPAHRLVHSVARMAVTYAPQPPLLYTFAARVPGIEDHVWNESDPAHLVLDVRPWLDAKAAAAGCHATQHRELLRRHPGETLRQALREVEAFYRLLPPAEDGAPQDAFAELLVAAGAWRPEPEG